MPPKFTLSPEQQAAAEAKRAARVAKKAATPVPAFTYPEQPFLKRDVHWFGSQGSPQSTSICTWNVSLKRVRKPKTRSLRTVSQILAQALIRRTLFPGSDCLRWSQRSSQFSQLLHYDPSLVALQEVDRLDDHTKFLQHGGWQWIYEKGYKAKQHGLLLAWKESQFEKVKSDWVKLDELSIDGTSRTGLSRKTRNIGLCAALRKKSASSDDEQGVILATQ